MNRIALGAAQFGMDYGINNKRGMVPAQEVYEILNRAIETKIDTLDTASAYGASEQILGNFMKTCAYEWKVISKLPECEYNQVEAIVDSSLKKLNLARLYGCLIHSFAGYKRDNGIWEGLERLKAGSKVKKIGFSLYYPQELEFILQKNLKIDIVQLPFNVFDHRFLSYFPYLRKKKIDIYVRSVFLQGLVFKQPEQLDGYFNPIRSGIEELNSISVKSKIPVFALCLNFVLKDSNVNKAIVGVDSLQNFNEIMRIADFSPKLNVDIMHRLSGLIINDENMLLPFKWKTEAVAN